MVIGVDGCRAGWLAIIDHGNVLNACIVGTFDELQRQFPAPALIAIDIPIGLPQRGARECDRKARQLLGFPRRCSVFPAPIRPCAQLGEYPELNARHRKLDGRGMTRQTHALLEKVIQVDRALIEDDRLRERVHEIHPEGSFYYWNRGAPMAHRKSSRVGREERERLIDAMWPADRERLLAALGKENFERDDLNDAFAALWSARRIRHGDAIPLPCYLEKDEKGLPIRILA
jgi:predicted RNase H-like nuclease